MGNKSEAIKEAYQKSGLSYTKLAELLGVSSNTFACWLSERRTPPDYVVDMIVEKVDNYVNGGGEYINKRICEDTFTKAVYGVFENIDPENQPEEIIKAFNDLPTVSLGKNKLQIEKSE